MNNKSHIGSQAQMCKRVCEKIIIKKKNVKFLGTCSINKSCFIEGGSITERFSKNRCSSDK